MCGVARPEHGAAGIRSCCCSFGAASAAYHRSPPRRKTTSRFTRRIGVATMQFSRNLFATMLGGRCRAIILSGVSQSGAEPQARIRGRLRPVFLAVPPASRFRSPRYDAGRKAARDQHSRPLAPQRFCATLPPVAARLRRRRSEDNHGAPIGPFAFAGQGKDSENLRRKRLTVLGLERLFVRITSWRAKPRKPAATARKKWTSLPRNTGLRLPRPLADAGEMMVPNTATSIVANRCRNCMVGNRRSDVVNRDVVLQRGGGERWLQPKPARSEQQHSNSGSAMLWARHPASARGDCECQAGDRNGLVALGAAAGSFGDTRADVERTASVSTLQPRAGRRQADDVLQIQSAEDVQADDRPPAERVGGIASRASRFDRSRAGGAAGRGAQRMMKVMPSSSAAPNSARIGVDSRIFQRAHAERR